MPLIVAPSTFSICIDSGVVYLLVSHIGFELAAEVGHVGFINRVWRVRIRNSIAHAFSPKIVAIRGDPQLLTKASKFSRCS